MPYVNLPVMGSPYVLQRQAESCDAHRQVYMRPASKPASAQHSADMEVQIHGARVTASPLSGSCFEEVTRVLSTAGVCSQVLATTAAIAITATLLHSSVPGAGAIILGGGMALSSTAVAMQVLQDRAETGTRHGRAAFSVLLFQVRRH